jgi:hypothetical protein
VIRKEHRVEIAEIARAREPALANVALEVADAVHALIADCTAAVVVAGAGSEWKMLAQSGPDDLSCSWRRLVAGTVRVQHLSGETHEAVVVPLASARIRALLVAVPRAGTSLPAATSCIVRPLLDAGGILLDATLSEQPVPSARSCGAPAAGA